MWSSEGHRGPSIRPMQLNPLVCLIFSTSQRLSLAPDPPLYYPTPPDPRFLSLYLAIWQPLRSFVFCIVIAFQRASTRSLHPEGRTPTTKNHEQGTLYTPPQVPSFWHLLTIMCCSASYRCRPLSLLHGQGILSFYCSTIVIHYYCYSIPRLPFTRSPYLYHHLLHPSNILSIHSFPSCKTLSLLLVSGRRHLLFWNYCAGFVWILLGLDLVNHQKHCAPNKALYPRHTLSHVEHLQNTHFPLHYTRTLPKEEY